MELSWDFIYPLSRQNKNASSRANVLETVLIQVMTITAYSDAVGKEITLSRFRVARGVYRMSIA